MHPFQQLKDVFAECFGLPNDADFNALEYRGIAEWDSASHLNLIDALETAFNISLSTDEILTLRSFTQGQKILEGHGIKFESCGS